MFVSVLLCVFVFSSTHYEARTRLWRKVLRRDEVKKKSVQIARQDTIKFSCICSLSQLRRKYYTVEMLFSVGAVFTLHHLNFQVEEKHLEVL